MLDWLQGYKTYIAAGIAALVAANGVLGYVPKETQDALLAVAISLGLYGLRSAIATQGPPANPPPRIGP